MTIEKKSKDHVKNHAGVSLATTYPPRVNNPLCFWTNHPAENTLVDLRSFEEGQFENPHPLGGGNWGGAFSGRPILIRELFPAVEARLSLARAKSVQTYLVAVRGWFRLLDAIEQKVCDAGKPEISRVESIADLTELHEAAAHRSGMEHRMFARFLTLVNDARKLMRMSPLLWSSPQGSTPQRMLLPDVQAKELRILLKQEWERVRRSWATNDAVRAEALRRESGENAIVLTDHEEQLLANFVHYCKMQKKTGLTLLNGDQILDGTHPTEFSQKGLQRKLMREILFPTLEQADIAFHLALMNSGWNPSTMFNVDATLPFVVAPHPKDDKQLVLSAEREHEIVMQADKPRSQGRTQFSTGLKKNFASAPMIVVTYLKRVEMLRSILLSECEAAIEKHVALQETEENRSAIDEQYNHVERLKRGIKSVWLYVDNTGKIKWLDGKQTARYERDGKGLTYLKVLFEGQNAIRQFRGKPVFATVTASDFRDIYARWVHRQSGGNIISVMLALGHASVRSTVGYLENNIFSSENDQQSRRFMNCFFDELKLARVDLTILTQLVRHGALTPEMELRLADYRKLMRSRLGIACADPRRPPPHVAPNHVEGHLCGTQRCLKDCQHAKFLPESLQGIAMRVEELQFMSDHLPRETWLQGGFETELEAGKMLLESLFSEDAVVKALELWRGRIVDGSHHIPGLGPTSLLKKAL